MVMSGAWVVGEALLFPDISEGCGAVGGGGVEPAVTAP